MTGSTRFAVAVHALAVLGYLEERGVQRVPSTLIARSVATNAVVIRNLLRALKHAGLVVAKEGRGGGARLSRPASRISLRDIHAAVERDGALAPSRRAGCDECPVSRGMRSIFPSLAREVDRAVARVLRNRTLQQVIDRL